MMTFVRVATPFEEAEEEVNPSKLIDVIIVTRVQPGTSKGITDLLLRSFQMAWNPLIRERRIKEKVPFLDLLSRDRLVRYRN